MSDITDFIEEMDRTSPFVKFEEGEPVVGVFKGAKIVDDTFNEGQKTMEYTIEVDGVTKTFKSGSGKLARQMAGRKEGVKLELVRTGESFKTEWYVKEVK